MSFKQHGGEPLKCRMSIKILMKYKMDETDFGMISHYNLLELQY